MLRAAPARDDLVVDGSVRLSSAALDDAVARVTGGLRTAGVRRGDAVAWQLANCWEAIALLRACWRIGAVAVPVHHQAGAAEVDAMLGAVTPALVVDAQRVTHLLAAEPARRGASARPADPAAVLFTSGSSGEPKGVIHTHRGLAGKARLMLEVHALTCDDAVLMPAPLAHISGLLNGVLLPGVAGMRAVVTAKWDPDAALDVIEAELITFMVGPPTFFVGLRGASGFRPGRAASLRLLSCGGAGVTSDFVAETADDLGCVVKRTYGSTEAPTVTTWHAGDPPARARTTDGRATGEVELRIAAGGEVQVRGPELFAGYTDRARNDAAFAPGGWFRTGDRGMLDDGWLTVTGRIKDVIIRGGENISCAEVEATCEAHPDVRHAVAVGEPDDRLGERVTVFVVVAPGTSFGQETCVRWFEARGVARFKTPERVIIVDSLPTMAAGKPDREALRHML
jgi:cyclohexanecarboxylate-CoA ligase